MFVRQLIGREAGTIINLPAHAAEASLLAGTVSTVTDEELAEAGLNETPAEPLPYPEQMPPGFRAEPSEDGGFDVLDAGGVTLNTEFIPNLPAARSFAHDYVAAQSTTAPAVDPEPNLDKLSRAELDALAASRNIDVSKAKNKAEVVALLQGEGVERQPDFGAMSDDELKAYAEEHEIDLADATEHADVIAAIEAAAKND
jgi:hypothetical protein